MPSRLWKRIGIGAAALAAIAAGLYFHLGVGTLAAQPRLTGTVARDTIAVKGQERSFVLYVPRNLKPKAPLVFVFHGSGGDGESTREATGFEFDQLADANGFLVAYPDGYQTTWNDCRKASPQPARRMNIDDKSFVEAMIAKEAAERGIDAKRVFAAGHSNGAQLSYRLALERPENFAGIAAISASLPTPENLACQPLNAPMPVMVINGTEDPINPFDGGEVRIGFTSLGTVLSTRGTAEYFARLNGQEGPPKTVRLPHRNASDPTFVEQTSWTMPGKPPVVMVAIHGGGHVVPQRYFQYPGMLGRQTGDLDAPAAIWEFFSKLPSRP